MTRLVQTGVHRLVVVGNGDRLCGMVSQSDILSYLLGDTKHTGHGQSVESVEVDSKAIGSLPSLLEQNNEMAAVGPVARTV